MQDKPKTPWAAKTSRSAVTPAPEDGSYPAMLRTVFTRPQICRKGSFGIGREKNRKNLQRTVPDSFRADCGPDYNFRGGNDVRQSGFSIPQMPWRCKAKVIL